MAIKLTTKHTEIQLQSMDIVFTKLSSDEHQVSVTRRDKSTSSITLNSRSFLRHDFAHFALEKEIPIKLGYWGLVANGADLSGEGLFGKDIELAEKLAGPIQTLIRLDADSAELLTILNKIQPSLAYNDLANRIWECVRMLQGRWKATAFGDSMKLTWSDVVTKP